MKKILFLLMLLITTNLTFSQNVDVDKYKSLFTFNFIKFISYEDVNQSGDFNIGVLRNEKLYQNLQNITTGKKYGESNIKVQYFTNINEITPCEVIYISTTQMLTEKTMTEIKSKLGTSQTTLIITDTKNGLSLGSMINFVIVDNILKFEIDIANVEKSGLKISNSLTGLNNAIVK